MLAPNHSLRKCGSPEALTSTTILKKCGVGIFQEGRNTTSRKPILSFHTCMVIWAYLGVIHIIIWCIFMYVFMCAIVLRSVASSGQGMDFK